MPQQVASSCGQYIHRRSHQHEHQHQHQHGAREAGAKIGAMLNLSGREILSDPDPPLSRQQYILTGLGLMLLKYAVDAALITISTNFVWTPVDYVLSLANLSGSKAITFSPALSVTLLVWTLPFLWAGVLLSVRRAKDAGLPGWIVVAFFIPLLNYLLMFALAIWPTAPPRAPTESVDDSGPPRREAKTWGLLAGIGAGVVTGFASVGLGVLLIKSYGVAIFLMTPFLIGAVSAFVTRRINPSAGLPIPLVIYTMGVIAALSVLIAFEGVVCVFMALPLAVPIGFLGGIVGHNLAANRESRGMTAMLLLLVPAGHGADVLIQPIQEREVLSSVEIAAAPEQVWRHVVSFEEIRTPPAWYFRMGLAYPLRARIEGKGAGAVRHCEFTTGAFTEPITVWDEPRRLAFDVVSQPAPLQEWSPYREVYAPHIKWFFRTTKGEFRLVELPGGRTRLEGRTWYSLAMHPQAYWTVFGDVIIHRIHHRVLAHIKAETEIR